VLPAYNEAANLRELLPEIVEVCEALDRGPFEVLVVDDGSTDTTLEEAQYAATLWEQIRVVELRSNYGQSAALGAGLDFADGEIIVPMDADGQNDPRDIPLLIDRIDEGADCVSGWRRDRQDPLSKRVPSEIQTRLAKLTGPDINDFGCTLTAYRAGAVAEVDLRGERHRYIPAQLHDLGYEVTEVEVNHRERTDGDSHYGSGRLVRGFVDLLYHLFRVRYVRRPMHLFGTVGLVLFGMGSALGAGLTVQRYVLGVAVSQNIAKLVLAVTLALFGGGLVALGVVTELLTELLYDDERPYRVKEVY
jgi:glycosyltransferase involved in cell wall biosynthesis